MTQTLQLSSNEVEVLVETLGGNEITTWPNMATGSQSPISLDKGGVHDGKAWRISIMSRWVSRMNLL